MGLGPRLSEEETNRSILVKNIPSNATEEQLLNHFQRRKNGGGEVDMVTMEQTAIVTFESPEVSRRVLQVKQELGGEVLQVERIKTEDCCEDEVFSLVTAQIDIRMLEMTIEEACDVMETIHAETGIHWHRSSSALFITGSFTEIQYTRRCLKYLCEGRGPSNLPNELNSCSREHISVDKVAKMIAVHKKQKLGGGVLQLQPCKQARHHLETKIQHARKFLTEAMEKQEDLSPPSRDVAERPSEAVLNDKDHSNTREEALEPQVYETNERFRKYFGSKYQEQLKGIEQKFNISIQWSQKLEQVILKPGPYCQAKTFSVANKEFVTLYQDVHKDVSLKRFTLFDANQYIDKCKIISEICKEYTVLIEKSQDRVFFEIFGEEEAVNSALEKIDRIVEICLEVPAHASGNYEAQASDKSSVQTQMRGTGHLSKILPGDVKISVYQGDITDQRVDAIVNAANEWLAHDAGVSEAIQRKGGHIIYKESKEITSRQGPVKVGKAVITNSGNLPCKFVIHVVGPDWLKEGDRKSKALLKAACLNSLKEAEELEVDSIAIPAISSGSYGMPKEVCAEVMFSAVEEYSTNMAPGFKVNDVRFVNIDDATVKVFREEFLKRYGQPPRPPFQSIKPHKGTAGLSFKSEFTRGKRKPHTGVQQALDNQILPTTQG